MVNKSRKVILIFVEGESDETVVGFVTDSLVEQLDQMHITLKVMYGDVFSDRKYSSSSGPQIASDKIIDTLKKEKLKAKDLLFVAFVTDTDGIFINPTSLVIDSSIEPKDSFQYDLEAQIMDLSGSLYCQLEIAKQENLDASVARVKEEKGEALKQAFSTSFGLQNEISLAARLY